MPVPTQRLAKAVRQLRSPALVAYAIAGLVAVASFLSTMILARASGAAAIGEYALAMSTANLLSILAVLGLDRVLIREVAGDLRQGRGGKARASARRMAIAVMVSAFVVSLLYLALVATGLPSRWMNVDWPVLAVVAVPILIWPPLRLGVAALRAAGMPISAQTAEALPTWLMTIGNALALMAGVALSGLQVTAMHTGFLFLTLLTTLAILLPRASRWSGGDDDTLPPRLLSGGLLFTCAIAMQAGTEWLLLAKVSASLGAVEAGAFRVVTQIITIFTILATTTESYVAPRVAGDFRMGDRAAAWKRHWRATWLLLLLGAPMLIAVMLFAEPLLSRGFGPEFANGAQALVIMAAAQILLLARGPVGAMLSMSGHERMQLLFSAIALLLTFGASLVLIPRYGLLGAAWAYAIPVTIRSVGSVIAARLLIKPQAVEPVARQ